MVSVSAVEKRSIRSDRQYGRRIPGYSDSRLTATGSRFFGERVSPKLRWTDARNANGRVGCAAIDVNVLRGQLDS